MNKDNNSAKAALRQELAHKWSRLWPDSSVPNRPPLFTGSGRAAERLRRLPEYKKARVLTVMADPILLQVRINALNDAKNLIAATPGLKQGLVRLVAEEVPMAHRPRMLTGNNLGESGRRILFPKTRINKVDLLVGTVMAVDNQGNLLGDGRGLFDLLYAILRGLKAMNPQTPVAVLAADEQIMGSLPQEPWDVRADLVVTPNQVVRHQSIHPAPRLDGLPKSLSRLPLVKTVTSLINPS